MTDLKKKNSGEFPDDPVDKTPCFYCKGLRLDPWSWNKGPTCHVVRPKQNKKYEYSPFGYLFSF